MESTSIPFGRILNKEVGEYNLLLKMKILPLVTTEIELEVIIVSEISKEIKA